MKLVEIDGTFYRLRRGRLVPIPTRWVGQTVHKQTIKKRHPVSKRTRKNKNRST